MNAYSVVFLLTLYRTTEGGSYIGYAKTHSDGLQEHGIDEGWLTVNVSTDFQIEIYSLNDECWKCPFVHIRTSPGLTQTTVIVKTAFGTTIALRRNDTEFCRFYQKFTEGGNYWLFVDTNVYKTGDCDVLLVNNPLPTEMPILYLFLGLCALAVVFAAVKAASSKMRNSAATTISTDSSTDSRKNLELPSTQTKAKETRLEMTSQNPKPLEPTRRRLKSLDAFRGLSLVVMMFASFGGGGYWFFGHSAWNGITITGLVFPWFIFIMGTSMNFSFKGMIRLNKTKFQIFKKIVKRSILLFLFGVILNTRNGPISLKHIRILGVLQRFGMTYCFLATIELIFINNYRTDHKDSRFAPVRDIISLAPQWIISLVVMGVYLGITYWLPYPGCPTGYVGPGGLHDNGKHYNCTGGVAQYIDLMILGRNHMYQYSTQQGVYKTILPFEPEGFLSTLTTILLCFLGIQAGRTLICFKTHKERISRWIIWAIATGCIAALLCKGTTNDGWIPVNKNLWSVSFLLVAACFAFLLLSAMYIFIDILKIWDGDPFIYPGMNSIVVYCCFHIFYDVFPVNWKVKADHLSLILKASWDTALFVVLAYVLYRRKIFFAL